uniref:AB hydrolase-1 domain-containing protein n=1 Tax=Globisporangium ultimum (strain ATCC 200006 / CBS 805.95 / DAOM BR144) TaxID=431595 RepID=K3WWC1_GLOUD
MLPPSTLQRVRALLTRRSWLQRAYLLAALVSAYLLLVVRNRTTHKRIIAGDSPLNNHIAQGMKATLARYMPTWWANGHVQIFLTFLVRQARIKYKRDVLVLEDGGHASLDWALESSAPDAATRTQKLPDDAPIVVILHGLTGCSDNMRSLCAEAFKHGYRPVVFNKRGHGGVKLMTPRLQGFGCVKDLTEAIVEIEKAYPRSKLYGIGLSAGSGLLTSYLGETGGKSRLEAGVMISPGYNTYDLFCLGRIHRLYDVLMTFALKKLLLEHKRELQDVIDVFKALRVTSVREFDEHVYMKLNGYADLESYWVDNNPSRAYDNVQRPTLCINALDDPVCTKENIAYNLFEDHPRAMLIETEAGSHCGFFEGDIPRKSWSNEVAMRYLDLVREYQSQRQQQQ